MSITVHWDTEDEDIVIFEFPRTFTWDEFYEVEARAREMVTAHNRRVGYIFVFPKNPQMPDNAISHGKRFIENRHDLVEIGVIVGSNSFFRTMVNLGLRMHPTARDGATMTDSIDEAREIIRDRLKNVQPLS